MQRVYAMEHDVRDGLNPHGVLRFLAREGGFRAVRWIDVYKVHGSLGATEARKSNSELEQEARKERKRERMAERTKRIAARKARGTRRKL